MDGEANCNNKCVQTHTATTTHYILWRQTAMRKGIKSQKKECAAADYDTMIMSNDSNIIIIIIPAESALSVVAVLRRRAGCCCRDAPRKRSRQHEQTVFATPNGFEQKNRAPATTKGFRRRLTPPFIAACSVPHSHLQAIAVQMYSIMSAA